MTTTLLPPIIAAGMVTDSLGREWDPREHPRGRDGRFIHTFKRIRAFLDAIGTDPWMTGQVTRINPDGSVRVKITKTTDPNLVDPSSGQPYIGHEVDVTPDLVESINEKAVLDLDGSEEKQPSAYAEKGWGGETTTWKSFLGRFNLGGMGSKVNDETIINTYNEHINTGKNPEEFPQRLREMGENDVIANFAAKQMAYAAGLRLRYEHLKNDNTYEGNEKFRRALEEMGVPPEKIDDTPDGMSGIQWLADEATKARYGDKDPVYYDVVPLSSDVVREMRGNKSAKRMLFKGDIHSSIDPEFRVADADQTDEEAQIFPNFVAARARLDEPDAGPDVPEDTGETPPSSPNPKKVAAPDPSLEPDPDDVPAADLPEEEPTPDELDELDDDVEEFTDVDTADVREIAQDLGVSSDSEYAETYADSINGIATGVEEGSYSVEEARSALRDLAQEIDDEADDFDNPALKKYAKNLRAAADNLGVTKKAELPAPEEQEEEVVDEPAVDEPAVDDDWTQEQLDAVDEYVSSSQDINDTLRDAADKELVGGLKEYTDTMDGVIGEFALTEDTTLYRGLNAADDAYGFEDFLASLKVGETIRDHGYMSTSLDPEIAERFVSNDDNDKPGIFMEISAPEGAAALPMSAVPIDMMGMEEHELLFPRKSRLYIETVDVDPDTGVTRVKARLLAEGEEPPVKVDEPDVEVPSGWVDAPADWDPNGTSDFEEYDDGADELSGPFTKLEMDALTTYSGPGARKLNKILRANKSGNLDDIPEGIGGLGGEPISDVHLLTKTLDDFIASRPEVGTYKQLYRGMAIDPTTDQDFLDQLQPGMKFRDRGFLSTSTDSGVADSFADGLPGHVTVTFSFTVDEGMHAVNMDAVTAQAPGMYNMGENEWLFGRNVQIEVDDVQLDYAGNYFVGAKLTQGDKDDTGDTGADTDAEEGLGGGEAQEAPGGPGEAGPSDVDAGPGGGDSTGADAGGPDDVEAGPDSGGEEDDLSYKSSWVDVDGEITNEEINAVDTYQGAMYWGINQFLRGHPDYQDGVYEDPGVTLKELMAKSKTKESMVVYRGMKEDDFAPEDWQALIDQFEEGNVIGDAGFWSTTTDENVGQQFSKPLEEDSWGVVFEIDVAAGTPAIDMNAIAGPGFTEEQEILFPPGSKLEIIEVDQMAGNRHRIVGRLIADPSLLDPMPQPADTDVPGDADAPSTDVDAPDDPVDSLDQALEAPDGKKFEVLDDPGTSGDGYYPTTDGSKLWGKYGAAGVMVRHTDTDGTERFLMVQRGPIVSTNKGKWQLPGGALNSNENDYQGTARELNEELQSPDGWLDGLTISGEVNFEHPSGWHYNNIAADSPEQFEPTVDGTETGDAKWFTREEIAQLPLHPALEKNLDAIFGQFSTPEPNDGQIVPFDEDDDLAGAVVEDSGSFKGGALQPGQIIDAKNWESVGGQQGSNQGGTFVDENGQSWYVKSGKTEEHAKNEALAAAFYKEAGIDMADLQLADTPYNKLGTASPLIPGAKSDLKQQLNDPQYKDDLAQGFAVDAWLANWDVAGLVFDNIVSDENGVGVRIDPGGALLFRAQGAPKGGAFGHTVGELQTFKDKQNTSSRLFDDMTLEDEILSAQKVLAISPERIDELVDSFNFSPQNAADLKSTLKARRAYIASYYSLDLPENASDEPNLPDGDGSSDLMADYEMELDLTNVDPDFDWSEFQKKHADVVKVVDEDSQASEDGQAGYHMVALEGPGWALKDIFENAFPESDGEDFENTIQPISFAPESGPSAKSSDPWAGIEAPKGPTWADPVDDTDIPGDDDDDEGFPAPSTTPTAEEMLKGTQPQPSEDSEPPLADWEKELLYGGPGPDSEDWENMVDYDGKAYRWDQQGNKIRVGDAVVGTDGIEMTIKKFEKNNKGIVAVDAEGKQRIRHRKKVKLVESAAADPTPAPEPDTTPPGAADDVDPPTDAPEPESDAPNVQSVDNDDDFSTALASYIDSINNNEWSKGDKVIYGTYEVTFNRTSGELTFSDWETGEIFADVDVADPFDDIVNNFLSKKDANEPIVPSEPDAPVDLDVPAPSGNNHVFSTWENDKETFAYDFQGFVNDVQDGNVQKNDYFDPGDGYAVTYDPISDNFVLWKFNGPGEDIVEEIPNTDDTAGMIQTIIKSKELGPEADFPDPPAPAAPAYDAVAELEKIHNIPLNIGAVKKMFPGQMDEYQAKQFRNAGYALNDSKKFEVDSPEWNLAVNKAIFNLTASGEAGKMKLAEVVKWRTDALNFHNAGAVGGTVLSDISLPEEYAPLPDNATAVYETISHSGVSTSKSSKYYAVVKSDGVVDYHYPDGNTWPGAGGATDELIKNSPNWVPFGSTQSVSAPTPVAPAGPDLSKPHKLDVNGNPMFIGDKVTWLSKGGKEVTITGFENNDIGVIATSIDPVTGAKKKHALNRKKLKVMTPAVGPAAVPNKSGPPPVVNGGSGPVSSVKKDPNPDSPWFGVPAPEKPKLDPNLNKAGTKMVSDAWLEAADQNYRARMKSKNASWVEKPLSSSTTYHSYLAVQKGDKNALTDLFNAGRITQELHDNALAQIQMNNKEYEDAFDKHKIALDKWYKDTKEWRDANGLPSIQLKGMDEGTLKLGNKEAMQWMYDNQVAGGLNPSGEMSTSARNGIDAQKGSNISGALRAGKEKTLDPEWMAQNASSSVLGADQAMLESPPLKQDFNVVRTFAMDSFIDPDTGQPYTTGSNMSNVAGTIQHDWGFAETSVGSFDAGATTTWGSGRPVEMELRLPAGLRVVYTEGPTYKSGLSGERGLILERGIAYYIHKVEKINGKWRLFAEVISKDVNYDQFGHFINENPFFD